MEAAEPLDLTVEPESLTIQEVAERTELTAHTLRYYERAGLLRPIARNGGGHRRYGSDDVSFLIFLTRLRSTGMPIHGVREYAELVREGEHTVDARKRMLEEHRDEVLNHIRTLEQNLRILDLKIEKYAEWQGSEMESRKGLAEPCLEASHP